VKAFKYNRINEVKLYRHERIDQYKCNMTELKEEVNSLQDIETNLMMKLKSTEKSV